MLKRILNAIVLAAIPVTPAVANELEVVAEWNILPYVVENEDTKTAWEPAKHTGKRLFKALK